MPLQKTGKYELSVTEKRARLKRAEELVLGLQCTPNTPKLIRIVDIRLTDKMLRHLTAYLISESCSTKKLILKNNGIPLHKHFKKV